MAEILVYFGKQPEIDEVQCVCLCEASLAAVGDALA